MYYSDTIVAISTPLAEGGIGIVRLSGSDSIPIAQRVFKSPKGKCPKGSHRIFYGHIVEPDTGEVIDEVLLSIMKAPNTYTKQDVVEINCHGGIVSLTRVLTTVLKQGARLARPGEFTQRAVINGRIDLTQAEAVLDLIKAKTDRAHKMAMSQLRGGLSQRVMTIREELINLTSFVEAHIDFSDEDLPQLSITEIEKMANSVMERIRHLIGSYSRGKIMRDGLGIALIGRPNVGKSSLLNALLEEDRAIVTDIPGTTRDMVEGLMSINGIPIRLTDTAGIRDCNDCIELEGVKRAFMAMEAADLVILVFDGNAPLSEEDRQLLNAVVDKDTILVINKIDIEQHLDIGNMTMSIPVIKTSAIKGYGISELKNGILKFVSSADLSEAGWMANLRHKICLERVEASLGDFLSELRKAMPLDVLATHLRDALDAIGEIAGETTPEDILNNIFSNFCVGK